MQQKKFQPKDLSEICNINKSTLNGYLEDIELFPPIEVSDNNYRYYSQETVSRLNLFKMLKKKPFRLKEKEIKSIWKVANVQHLIRLYNQSSDGLFDYLKKNNFL